ncbi:unnamed protein product [Adineta ricciae]|uniref:Uncharacterized protein n=1 Tax=Adineta ricciae TaxID=249248 RepID=A0A815FEX0_ADIRI|nr:unnamed protein product [Adineta ricciae]
MKAFISRKIQRTQQVPAAPLPPDSGRNCTGNIRSVPDRFKLEVCTKRSGNDWNLRLNFRRQGNGRKTNLTGRNRPCHNNLGSHRSSSSLNPHNVIQTDQSSVMRLIPMQDNAIRMDQGLGMRSISMGENIGTIENGNMSNNQYTLEVNKSDAGSDHLTKSDRIPGNGIALESD